MINKEILIKQIIYRSSHRGTKEMDLLLGNFVKKNVYSLTHEDLYDLLYLLSIDDEALFNWYTKKSDDKIPTTRVSKLLKEFKI